MFDLSQLQTFLIEFSTWHVLLRYYDLIFDSLVSFFS